MNQKKEMNDIANIRDLDVDYSKYEEKTKTSGAMQIPVCTDDYKVFPVEDENAVYKIKEPDYRGEIGRASCRERV